MPQPLSNLPTGTKVKDTHSMSYSAQIVFRIIAHSHAGYPTNSTAFITDKVIDNRAFSGGSNRYSTSSIRTIINNGTSSLFSLSTKLKNAILPTTFRCALAGNPTTFESLTDKVFLLSEKETGISSDFDEGISIAYFSTNATRQAYPTREVVANSDGGAISTTSPFDYWLRTIAYSNTDSRLGVMEASGMNATSDYAVNSNGLRPVFNLPSNTLVTDSPDNSDVYTIIWNDPPTVPPSMNIPNNIIRSGKPVAISWDSSIDPEGDAVSYDLARHSNDGIYTNIYSGPLTSYEDNGITSDMDTVRYRVWSKDSYGNASAYLEGETYSVLHNADPTITGQDTNISIVTSPPSSSFSVDDVDVADILTLYYKIDDQVVNTINNAVRNQEYTFTLSNGQFYKLLNGSHIMSVLVADSVGNELERKYTFTRQVERIEFISINPSSATDVKLEKVLISLNHNASPNGVILKVCNNALDEIPSWEIAQVAQKHIFSNETKTAEQWAIGLWVTIDKISDDPISCGQPSGAYM